MAISETKHFTGSASHRSKLPSAINTSIPLHKCFPSIISAHQLTLSSSSWMLKFIAMLFWALSSMAILSNAAAVGTCTTHNPTNGTILPRNDCLRVRPTGEAFHHSSGQGLLPAPVGSCDNLFKYVQRRAGEKRTSESKYECQDGCCVTWKNLSSIDGFNPSTVSFNDLVAPIAVAISQGTIEGQTLGTISNRVLGGRCADIFIGKRPW